MKNNRVKFREVADGIFLLPVPFFGDGYFTASVLVRGKDADSTYLIDSGEDAEHIRSVLVPALAEIGLEPHDVGCLLATHTHGDHIGGHAAFRALSGCRVAAYAPSVGRIPGIAEAEPLADGAVLGGRLKLISAPGHADDAVVWLDLPTRTLITGDSFQSEGTYGCELALVPDPDRYLASLGAAEALAPSLLVPGHAFLPFEDVVPAAEVGAFFRRSREVVAEYVDFVRGVLASAPTISDGELTEKMVAALGKKYDPTIVPGGGTAENFRRYVETRFPERFAHAAE